MTIYVDWDVKNQTKSKNQNLSSFSIKILVISCDKTVLNSDGIPVRIFKKL